MGKLTEVLASFGLMGDQLSAPSHLSAILLCGVRGFQEGPQLSPPVAEGRQPLGQLHA